MQRHSLSQLPLYPLLLVFFELGAYLSNDAYLPALPQISQDFQASASLAQMTLTAFFLGAASLFLLLGPISDRYGRRPVILGGALLFTLSTMGCAIAPTIEMLILARFFQGLSLCSIGSAGYATIHELYDQHTAIQFIALMGVITLLAPALGPLVGALLMTFMSWRGLFWILALWGLVSGLCLWRWMPESLPAEKRHPLNWRVTVKQYGDIIINLRFMGFCSLFCLPMVAAMAWLTAGPFMVMETWHYSTLMFGVIQTVVFGALVVGSYLVKPLMHRLGVLPLITFSTQLIAVSAVSAFVLTWIFPDILFSLILPLMVFMLGLAMMVSPAQRLAIESLTEPMGVRMAMFSSVWSFFGFLGSFLASTTYNGTLLWLAWIMVIAAAIIVPIHVLQRREQ